MATCRSRMHVVCFAALVFFFVADNVVLVLAMAVKASLTVDLIHRDSTQSPFYNPTETPHRIGNPFLRSRSRARTLLSAASSFSPSSVDRAIPLTWDNGEFLMKYSVGQPPVEMFGIVDTSSELIWLQCQPCVQCYNQTSPVFDSRNSTSYIQLPCSSAQCQSFQGKSCSSVITNETCEYRVEYGDGSFSRGDLALETLTLASSNGLPITFPNTVIGCGHENVGNVFGEKSSGVVGFGATALSLVSQFASFVGWKFSYCLASSVESPSKLTFGPNADASGNDLISTPLILRDQSPLYYLTMEAISVGDNRIEYSADPISASDEGNIILDTGAPMTYLPTQLYSKLEAAVAQQMNLERVANPNGSDLSLCYKFNDTTSTIPAPIITAHFRNANLTLSSTNTFGIVSDEVRCLVFGATNGTLSIFGNFAQFNFLVSLDIQGRTVSFKPMDCTQQ